MNSITLSEKDIARFWKYVDIKGPDDCWEWKGGNNGVGHGKFFIRTENKKSPREYAHRVSWMIKNGDIPTGMLVCHKCDNPPCCNPRHLFIGTQKDNMKDASEKGRCKLPGFKGEQLAWSKLKEKDVVMIRKSLSEKTATQTELAKIYGVTIQAIWRIKEGRSWAWLK